MQRSDTPAAPGPEGSDGHEEVCVQRRCVAGECVQRSDTRETALRGLRAVTDTSPFHSAPGRPRSFRRHGSDGQGPGI